MSVLLGTSPLVLPANGSSILGSISLEAMITSDFLICLLELLSEACRSVQSPSESLEIYEGPGHSGWLNRLEHEVWCVQTRFLILIPNEGQD